MTDAEIFRAEIQRHILPLQKFHELSELHHVRGIKFQFFVAHRRFAKKGSTTYFFDIFKFYWHLYSASPDDKVKRQIGSVNKNEMAVWILKVHVPGWFW